MINLSYRDSLPCLLNADDKHRRVDATLLCKYINIENIEFVIDTGAYISMIHEYALGNLYYDTIAHEYSTICIGAVSVTCDLIEVHRLILPQAYIENVKFMLIPSTAKNIHGKPMTGYNILGENVLEAIDGTIRYSEDRFYYGVNKGNRTYKHMFSEFASTKALLQDSKVVLAQTHANNYGGFFPPSTQFQSDIR